MAQQNIKINTEFIKLEQLLKLADLVQSGGEAKTRILSEKVLVNGEVEVRRGKKIRSGDKVELGGQVVTVE